MDQGSALLPRSPASRMTGLLPRLRPCGTFPCLRFAAPQIIAQGLGEALLARAFLRRPGVLVHRAEKAEIRTGRKSVAARAARPAVKKETFMLQMLRIAVAGLLTASVVTGALAQTRGTAKKRPPAAPRQPPRRQIRTACRTAPTVRLPAIATGAAPGRGFRYGMARMRPATAKPPQIPQHAKGSRPGAFLDACPCTSRERRIWRREICAAFRDWPWPPFWLSPRQPQRPHKPRAAAAAPPTRRGLKAHPT